MKVFSTIVSYIFHPLIMVTLSLFYCFGLASFEFAGMDMVFLLIQVFILTYAFPALTIFMMKQLGLIKSIEMKDRMDRIGPLIACLTFYLWAFINFKSNNQIPLLFKISLLGTIFSMGLGFFMTIFTKISLHAIGVAGMLALVLISILGQGYYEFDFSWFDFTKFSPRFQSSATSSFSFSQMQFLPFAILFVGIVGSARLYLKAHTTEQILGGYLVGIFSMLIANGVLNFFN